MIASVRLPFDGVILVCQKCLKKLGKEGKMLRKTLKQGAREQFGKKAVRILRTGCFDLCPKGSITVGATGKTNPLRLAAINPGASADQIFGALGLKPDAAPDLPSRREVISTDG